MGGPLAVLQTKLNADEAESMLGHRRTGEHEAVSSMKTEFMQLWDGFNTDPSANIMVLAATNRPYDLDEAVLRRCSSPFSHICGLHPTCSCLIPFN